MAQDAHAGMLARQIAAQTDKEIVSYARELLYAPGWEMLPESAVETFRDLYHAVTFALEPVAVRTAALKMADVVRSLEDNQIWSLQEARSFYRSW